MTINVRIHLIDGNTYTYEYRKTERFQTPEAVADQLAHQLAELRDNKTAMMQRADDEDGHAITILPLASIVRVQVDDHEPFSTSERA